MVMTTFAAIDVGSYETSMKIFELSKKVGFRELNDVRFRLELGKSVYSSSRLSIIVGLHYLSYTISVLR